MTLYLEWEATPTLTPAVKLLEGRKIDPHFYRLHVAIDNIASGHGALAKQAIKLHLDSARQDGGDANVQTQWQRIWNGYVAWATAGTFGQDMLQHLLVFDGKVPDQRAAYAEQQMLDMIARKAPAASKSHGRALLGGRPLNDLFDDPHALMGALLSDPEHWMDRDSPRDSRFLRELITFSGPMYKVFTDQDVEVILDWLDSLVADPAPPPPVADVGQDMKQVLSRYAARGQRQPQHRAFSFPEADGTTAKAVAAWFAGPLEEMMSAMARSEWVKPGSIEDSRFFTEVIGAEGLMPGVIAPEDEAVIRAWVSAGCPQPGAAPPAAAAPHQTLAALAAAPFATRRHTIGHGSVH